MSPLITVIQSTSVPAMIDMMYCCIEIFGTILRTTIITTHESMMDREDRPLMFLFMI